MANPFLRNLQRGFGLSLLILLISSVASYYSIYKLKDRAEWVNHTNIVLFQSEDLSALLSESESEQRGYLLSGYSSFLTPYSSTKANVYKSFDTLTQLTHDNPKQRVNCRILHTLIEKRFAKLEEHINLFKTGRKTQPSDFLDGQYIMSKIRQVISDIQKEENRLLLIRNEGFAIYAWLTPLVLILTALSSILITINFYRKLKHDYDLRVGLQQNLEANEIETQKRIHIFEDIALKVSAGDYKVRAAESGEESLGVISVAFNKMASALDNSFDDFKNREWLKNGLALLSGKMIGEKDIRVLVKTIVNTIADYTNSHATAIYLLENDSLDLAAGVALNDQIKKKIEPGEGLVGQCASNQKMIVLNQMPQTDIIISYATGEVKPGNLIVFPVVWENRLKAVIETVSFQPYTAKEIQYYESIAATIGLSLESAEQYTRLQQLLSETQAQAEELQMQQHELEHMNYDLESQAQKLQVSEEELKVQQEELLQANQELEERSSMLEEKNQMIVERNLEIQKKAEEIEISTKYKSEFLANMSHELRTPLNSILLLSRLIAENTEKNLTKEQVEFATVIQNSGNGLLTLIDEILDLSKIEAGKMKVEFRDVTVNEIKNNLTAIFTPIAKDKNLPFSIEISLDAPVTIQTDSLRVEQVLKNLISNAIKFTSKGSVKMEVKPADGNKIQFIVTDTGIGIPADKQQLVFEAFQQADGSTRRKFGGTGLGLSISRELAKLLGGEIVLKSEAGKGSEFTLIIPVKSTPQIVAEEKPAQPISKPKIEKPVVAERVLPTGLDNDNVIDDRNNIKIGDKIILIIEDDTVFAQTLLSFAHKNNYKGLIAHRGDYGLQLANQFLPNAILLDIKLPVMDGWEVMDELKKNAVTKLIPVHMMSSMQVKEESLDRGAIDFIDKPASLEKLPQIFNTIEIALNRGPKKILIVEENEKHAQALCYFLESYNIKRKRNAGNKRSH